MRNSPMVTINICVSIAKRRAIPCQLDDILTVKMNVKLFPRRTQTNIRVHVTFLLLFYIVIKFLTNEEPPRESAISHKYILFGGNYSAPLLSAYTDVNSLAAKIDSLNCEREILNVAKYGPVEADVTIIAVQVGSAILRLQYLIASLEQVSFIDTALLVFSHSCYDDNVNYLVRSIAFCRVLQIYYPHSLQLHPNKFPGFDPDDCGNDTHRLKMFCSERNAALTEHKQHWWWKANLIFENLPWSSSYVGTVVFLEESDYVLPDFLHMLRYSRELISLMPEVEIISLGGPPYLRNMPFGQLTVDSWKPPYDKGLAFDKRTWRNIAQFSSFFCMYDDASWSYSLLNLFEHSKRGRADMVACMAPRVLSTGIFANGEEAMGVIQTRLSNADLFPRDVKALMLFGEELRVAKKMKPPPHGNGGWGDVRDHLLCLDPLMITTTEAAYDDSTTTPVFS